MSKEKTEYRFSVHAAPAVINQVIQNYLAANQYVQIPKPNANYYFFNDPWMKGKRSIEYYIHGTEVIVLAYMGTFEKPRGLEGFVGAVPKKSFRDDLEPLFVELHRIDMMGMAPQQGMPMQQGGPMQQGMPMQQEHRCSRACHHSRGISRHRTVPISLWRNPERQGRTGRLQVL